MSAALPCAGGTYHYAKRGLNRLWANLSGWHYIISVVAIGAGETLAFSNYFKILLEQLGVDISWLDSRVIAIALVVVFLILNFRGIEQSGRVLDLTLVMMDVNELKAANDTYGHGAGDELVLAAAPPPHSVRIHHSRQVAVDIEIQVWSKVAAKGRTQ